MPKLWILSDLHMENVPYPESFQPARPDFDVLVAAGDIWEADCLGGFHLLRKLAGDRPVVFVMGNHEYWNGQIHEELAAARSLAPEYGITLLEGDSALIAGCRFIGTTLWSDYALALSPIDPEAETGEQIDIAHDGGSHLITARDSMRLHVQARAHLEKLIDHGDGAAPSIVVTHHAPHPLCLPMADRDTWRAGNSASNLSSLTDSGRVNLWIHGHVHQHIDLLRPKGTRILCNPAGPGFSNVAFDETLVVDVDP